MLGHEICFGQWNNVQTWHNERLESWFSTGAYPLLLLWGTHYHHVREPGLACWVMRGAWNEPADV